MDDFFFLSFSVVLHGKTKFGVWRKQMESYMVDRDLW